MNIDPFQLFFEEFKYKLKKHNITCPHPEALQLATNEWQSMNQLQQYRFLYMAKRQEEAFQNFQAQMSFKFENDRIPIKTSKQDQKVPKYQFQINYCKIQDCESQADFIEQELQNINQNIIINRYAMFGNFGAVSVFGIQEKRPSILIWHTLINGPFLKNSQIQQLREKVQRFLTP